MKKLEELQDLTIMYVECNAEDQASLGKYLKAIFKNLHIFSKSVDALKEAKRIKPNILITNITQNRLNGIELIRALKQFNNDMEAIIISAEADKKNLLSAIRLDVLDFLEKPLKHELLEPVLFKAKAKIVQRKEFIQLKRKMLEDSIEQDDTDVYSIFRMHKQDDVPIEIISFFKGVPIINTGYIKDVSKSSIYVQTHSIQKLVMHLEKTINVESSILPKPIKLDVASIQSFSDPVKLENPRVKSFSLRRRKDVRLEPEKDLEVGLSVDRDDIKIKVLDISSELITFLLVNIEDADLLDNGKTIDSYIQFRLDKCGIVDFDFKSEVKILRRGEKSKIYAIKPLLEGQDREDYDEYILQREFQIITELKNLRLANGI